MRLFNDGQFSQANLDEYFDLVDELDDDDALAIVCALECGCDIKQAIENKDDVIIFQGTPEEWAEKT